MLLGRINLPSFLDSKEAFLKMIPYFCKDGAAVFRFHHIPSLVSVHIQA